MAKPFREAGKATQHDLRSPIDRWYSSDDRTAVSKGGPGHGGLGDSSLDKAPQNRPRAPRSCCVCLPALPEAMASNGMHTTAVTDQTGRAGT